MIIAWVLLGKISLPIYVHIMIYSPLLAYFSLMFVGYAYEYSIKGNSEYIAIV
jgi:hypothetical protein